MSRYFFALWPDNLIRDEIVNRSSRLDLKGSKTVKSNLHLTLVFMGKLHAKQLDDIISQAKSITCPTFDICLNHSGYFKNSKVSWLGLDSIPQTLLQLHRQLLEIIGQCSIDVKPQRYKPHVTLTRNSSFFDTQLINPVLWSVKDFALIESIDTVKGVEYFPIEYFKLNK
jgi:RNA 2',3'-cyclic 3'-phosphodiesterase